MWICFRSSLVTPLLRDSTAIGQRTTVPDGLTYVQPHLASPSISTFYTQSAGVPQVAENVKQQAMKDLMTLASSTALQSDEVTSVKEILARINKGRPLLAADVRTLATVMNSLQMRLTETAVPGVSTPFDREAVNTRADRIIELASGYTSEGEEQEILKLLKEVQNPAEMQALLAALQEKGWSFEDLLSEMDSDQHQAEFLRLTAGAMTTEQKAEAVKLLAKGYTSGADEKAIMVILREAARNPGEMKALLGTLEKQGVSFNDLFDELGDDEAEFLQLTASALTTEQKAEAIKQFVAGYTPSNEETAVLTLLASEADPGARDGLLKALEARDICYEDIAGELETPEQRTQFLNRYLRRVHYAELQARGIPMTDAAIKEWQQTHATVVKAADGRSQEGRSLVDETRHQVQQGQELSKQPAPGGSPQEMARDNRKLVQNLDRQVTANDQRGGQIKQQLKDVREEIAKVQSVIEWLRGKVAHLEVALRNRALPVEQRQVLERALQATRQDIGSLEAAAGRLKQTQQDLQTSRQDLEKVNTDLQTRRRQAVMAMLQAVERGADGEVARTVVTPSRTVAQDAVKVVEDYKLDQPPPGQQDTFEARVQYKIQHLGRLQEQAKRLDREAGRLERLEKQATDDLKRTQDAPPSTTDDRQFGNYQVRKQSEATLKALRENRLVGTVDDKGNPRPAILDEMGAVVASQMQRVYGDIQQDLSRIEQAQALVSFQLTGKGWTLLQQQPKTLGETRAKTGQLAAQIKETAERVADLAQRKAQAIDALGVRSAEEVTPELLLQLQAEAQKGGNVARAVEIMRALLTLQTVDRQIEGLQEISGHLTKQLAEAKEYIAAATQNRTVIKDNLTALLKAVGSDHQIGDVDDPDLQGAVRLLQKRLGMPETGNLDAQTLGAITQEIQQRTLLADRFINGTLIGSFSYTADNIKIRGVGDLSDAGMGRGISALRRELGLPDQPAGRLSDQERKELQALADGQQVDRPQSPLLQAMLDRQRKMAVFSDDDRSRLIQYIQARKGSGDVSITTAELLEAARGDQLPGEKGREIRDTILKLFTRDGRGELTPTSLYRMLESTAEGSAVNDRLWISDLQAFQPYMAGAQGSIPIAAFSDQRSEAEALYRAFKKHQRIDTGTDEAAVFRILKSKSRAEIMSLALAYKAKYGQDISEAIRSEMSYRDKGEAMYYLTRKDVPERVGEMTNAPDSMGFLANKDNAGRIKEYFQDNPSLADEAREVFQQYHAETDPAKRQALAQRFVQLKAMATATFYLSGNILDAQSWKRTWKKMDISQVESWKREAWDICSRYNEARDPAAKARLAQAFLQKVAEAHDDLQMRVMRESTANEDWGEDLGTALTITKAVAVVSTATVVTLATFGAGTAASASLITVYGGSLVAGTVAGTAMGAAMEAEQQMFTTGRVDVGDLGKATHGHMTTAFTTSFGTVTGMGFSKLGTMAAEYAPTVAKTSKFWGFVARHPTATQFVVGGTMNTVIDTTGRALQGQDITADRAFFAFLQGGVSYTVGLKTKDWKVRASIAKDTVLGTATEAAWAAYSGQPLEETVVQGLINNVVVGTVSARANKWVQGAQQVADQRRAQGLAPTDKPDWGGAIQFLGISSIPRGQKPTVTGKYPPETETGKPKQPVTRPREVEDTEAVVQKKPADEVETPLAIKKAPAAKRTPEHEAFETEVQVLSKQVTDTVTELHTVLKRLETIEQPIQAHKQKLDKLNRDLSDLKEIKPRTPDIEGQIAAINQAKKGPQAAVDKWEKSLPIAEKTELDGLRSQRKQLFKDFSKQEVAMRAKQQELLDYARAKLPKDQVAEVERQHGTDPADMKRIGEIRQKYNVEKGQNIAFADIAIDGMPKVQVEAVSGDSPQGTVPIHEGNTDRTLPAIRTGDNPRIFDTEYKILNDLSQRLKPGATGTIRLFTERACCISCTGAIAAFRKKFPGITIEINHGEMK